jgi:hypothetical protein
MGALVAPAMAHTAHGTLLGRRGDLTAAAEEIERGIAFGERLPAWQLIAYASPALAGVRQRQHDPAGAPAPLDAGPGPP